MNTDIRNLTKWLNEEQETPIDRQSLARVLAMSEQPAQRKPMTKQERDLIHAATGSMTFFKAVEHAISQTEEFHNIKAST